MAETRTKRRRLDFVGNVWPLFDELCEYIVSLTCAEFAGKLESLKDIKSKISNSTYDNAAQLVDDLTRVTSEICEFDTENTAFEFNTEKIVSELKSYIEMTIIPIKYAPGILKLYHLQRRTLRKQIKLDGNHSLPPKLGQTFAALSPSDRLKLFLRWPLAKIRGKRSRTIARSSLTTKNTVATADKSGTTTAATEETFTVDDSVYKVGESSMYKLLKYQIHITKKNHLDRTGFVEKYVNKYLESSSFNNVIEDPDSIYDMMVEAYGGEADRDGIPYEDAQFGANVSNETGVESLLLSSLYAIIRPLVKYSLELYKRTVSDNSDKTIEERKYVKLETGSSGQIKLRSTFTTDKFGSAFYGLDFRPDAEIGYFAHIAEPNDFLPVFYTNIAELKYITFQLHPCIQYLTGDKNGENYIILDTRDKSSKEEVTKQAKDGNEKSEIGNVLETKDELSKKESEKQTKDGDEKQAKTVTPALLGEVKDTIHKYTKGCIRLGLSRFIVTDLDGYLLVKLQFKSENGVPDDYATDKSKDSTYIKCQYSYFNMEEPYLRLYLLSVCAVDDDYLKEQAEFQLLINENLIQLRNSVERGDGSGIVLTGRERMSSTGHSGDNPGCTSKHDNLPCTEGSSYLKKTNFLRTPPASKCRLIYSDSNELRLINKKDQTFTSDSRQVLNSSRFDKTLFENPSYGEFADSITDLIRIGLFASQVVKINPTEFSRSIFERNMCVKGPFPNECILKVYDPYLGQLFEEDSSGEHVPTSYTYQDCINYTVRELKAYCLLSEFSGDFIPRLYAYGRLSDLYPYIDPLYLRLCGGYLMIELLEKDEKFNVTLEFLNNKILPLYQKMHSLNVLHNDVKWDNAIITTDGKFKIIDFGHSEISTSELAKKAELDLVYQKLRPDWYC